MVKLYLLWVNDVLNHKYLLYRRYESKSPNDLCMRVTDIIVDAIGIHYNLGRFKFFMHNFNRGVPDTVRIISFTIEGDPIITDVEYNGEVIKITEDNTYDKWAPEGGDIKNYYGKEIIMESGEKYIKYYLKDTKEYGFNPNIISYRKIKLNPTYARRDSSHISPCQGMS